MKRDEFMRLAESKIDEYFVKQRNRLMDLVERAWAEGERHAETERIEKIIKAVAEDIKKEIQPVVVPQPIQPFGEPITTPTWPLPPTITCDASKGNVPEAHFGEGGTDGDNDN